MSGGGRPRSIDDDLADIRSSASKDREGGIYRGPALPPDDSHDGTESGLGAYGRSLLATAANAAQAIPGMEAAQAGVRSVVRGQSYRDALGDIRGETSKLGTPLRIAGQLPGAIATTALMPGASPAAAGAMYGGASQALSADPDQSLGERAGRTLAGTAVGAFIPKAVQGLATTGRVASTAARSIGAATPATLLERQQQALHNETSPMYAKALREGQGAVVPPRVRAFLDRPDIREITAELQKLEKYKGVADDSPEMLQAIDRELSEDLVKLRTGVDLTRGGKPIRTSVREEMDQVGALKAQLSDAIAKPSPPMGPQPKGMRVTIPPMMPSQRAANTAFAHGKGLQDATRRGADAVAAAERGRSAGNTLDKSTPEAFEHWLKTKATPGEVDAFINSVLGETGTKVRSGLVPRSVFDLTVLPYVHRVGKAAVAGDRMLRAAQTAQRASGPAPSAVERFMRRPALPKEVTTGGLSLLELLTRGGSQ